MTDRRRIAAVLLALGLVAASCGSGDATSSTPTLGTTAPAADTGSSADAAPAADAGSDDTPDSAIADDAMDDDAMDDGATADEDGSEDATQSEESVQESAVNLFPDLDVQNISDGSTVNLASTLGGGTTATLLWFFAPH